MEFHVCGCRGSYPVFGDQYREFGGSTTCYILRDGDYAIILDCGSGLHNAREILANCKKIDVILTHLHYDHIQGLLCGGVFPKDAKIQFYSRFFSWFADESLRRFMSPPYWPWMPDFGELHNVRAGKSVVLEKGYVADFQDSFHPSNTILVRLQGKGKCICIVWDFEHGTIDLTNWVYGCDLLCYDGMYLSAEEYEQHRSWGHSTWEEGCRLAKAAHVKELWITHHNPEATDDMLRVCEKKAQEIFPATRFAREGDCITD